MTRCMKAEQKDMKRTARETAPQFAEVKHVRQRLKQWAC